MTEDIDYAPLRQVDEIPEKVTYPLEQREVDLDGAPPKVRALAYRFTEGEWPLVKVYFSRAWTTDEFYVGETEDHRRSDLRKPAHETRHWWLLAVFPALKLATRVGWEEGVTPKGAQSMKYMSAICHDPIGIPVELFVNYAPTAQSLKRLKGEPEEVHRQRVAATLERARYLDSTYNTGANYLNHTPVFMKAGEFDTWTREALAMSANYLERSGA